MDEREMIEKIKKSAQQIDVPKELWPEQIRKQLEQGKEQPAARAGRKKWYRYRAAAAAACLCLCFGAAGLAYRTQSRQQAVGEGVQMRPEQKMEESDRSTQASNGQQADNVQGEATEYAENADHDVSRPDTVLLPEPVKKLGKMYTLADDYGSVYDVLEQSAYAAVKDLERKEAAKAEDVEMDTMDDGLTGGGSSSFASDEALYNGTDFSSTNLQVEGVDESDIVKTDGSFLYVVQEAQICVLDVRQRMPKVAGMIRPDMDEDTDRICDMYVADGLLTVIIQTQTEPALLLDDHAAAAEESKAGTEGKREAAKALTQEDVWYMDTAGVTKVVTYQITDPLHPVVQDTAVQDGWYKTSRKIANRLILFTAQSLSVSNETPRENALKEDALQTWLPAVNGKVVSADCIYLPKQGREGLFMVSMDLADHSKVLDMKLVVNQNAELYVTGHSVYLYESAYTNKAVRTKIARFVLGTDGMIQAKAAKTVKGSITDTFALHERDGYLQVLTSVTSAQPWENRVYVLDEAMKVVGKLTGLAEGEQIYAARFAGTAGYFVTYRNTDPLFTVDFSDPRQPRVIGELKVTGFSEYLHFWSDSKLLGIGYETDPDSGETIGVKLSMFDISDPGNVTEEAKLVLKDASHSDAMYEYKSVLVDLKKNLIAFTTENYKEQRMRKYRVFSYDNGKFVSKVDRILAREEKMYDGSSWRSVYVGDTLYLVSEKKVIVFDMKGDWREIGKENYVKKKTKE